jgi:glycosyltransferase involved in cell wall biosynthesis
LGLESQQPLVSIIIPCYNYELYLTDALDSVMKQTYKKLKVIVVNYGFTNNTKEIVKRYPAKYIEVMNQGLAMAINKGIKISQADYFIVLSADDILAPSYVKNP